MKMETAANLKLQRLKNKLEEVGTDLKRVLMIVKSPPLSVCRRDRLAVWGGYWDYFADMKWGEPT